MSRRMPIRGYHPVPGQVVGVSPHDLAGDPWTGKSCGRVDVVVGGEASWRDRCYQ